MALRKERIRFVDPFMGHQARRLHLTEPDYTRPLLEMTPEQKERIMDKLAFLYGEERARKCFVELERIMRVYYAHKTPEMIEEDKTFDPAQRFTERDIILITYGDLIRSPGKAPLRALSDFLNVFMRGAINTIHILPFFPYSSDRGFAVIDFEQVDPRLGSWEDIEELSLHFRLMFDGVFNHVSSKSRWFQEFCNGNPRYQNYFISFSTKEAISPDHLKLILRPRTTDLLTGFHTINGMKYVWTTFSPDQIDLNYKNEEVLLRVIEILLYYVRRGADIIRLDAVTYLWSELGTSCAHLKQTHVVVQLFRAVLDVVAPRVALITETNVPHEENISYFGDGQNEAQMVYNFALPPLVLYTFLTGNCRKLAEWASTLERVSDTATYFNFLDSHDGIGLMAVKNILRSEEIDFLVEKARQHGGLVSYRLDGDGTRSPYELNITWYSALNCEDADESLDLQVDRFVASRAIALILMGVPGIYFHGLFGSPNDRDAILHGGEPRSINRKVVDERALFETFSDPSSSAYKIAKRFGDLIEKRIQMPAFHPNSTQRLLFIDDAVFCVLREAPDGRQIVLALTNVTAREQSVDISGEEIGRWCEVWTDVVSETALTMNNGKLSVRLKPYQVMWLTPHGMADQT